MSRVILQDEKEGELGDIELDRVPCPGEYCMFATVDSRHIYRVDRVVWAVDDTGAGHSQAVPVAGVSKVRVIAENENWSAPGSGGGRARRWPDGLWSALCVMVGLGLMLYGAFGMVAEGLSVLRAAVAVGGLGWALLGAMCVPCTLRRRSLPDNVVPLRRAAHKAGTSV